MTEGGAGMTEMTEERLARWEGEHGLWKAVADLIGECWPEWPSHGNAPLAIAAHIALIHEEQRRLRAELAAATAENERYKKTLERVREQIGGAVTFDPKAGPWVRVIVEALG